MSALSDALLQALTAVAPVCNVDIGDETDRSTWRAGFTDQATDEQKAAAAQVLVTFTMPDQTPIALKLAELSAACASEIVSGYESSALGTLHTYPSKITDQINMMGSVTDSLIPNLPAAWSTPFWCADSTGAWSYHMHTAAQIQQAGRDGKTAIATAQTKLALLNAEVMAATTADAVQAVTW